MGSGQQEIDLPIAGDAEFDLIICNIEMPEIDSYAFVRRICVDDIPVPIILLTGNDIDK